jgi:hypothetical protein
MLPSAAQNLRRVGILIAVSFLCAVLPAGCGAADPDRTAASEPPETTTTAPWVNAPESWGIDIIEPDVEGRAWLVGDLDVFSRPRSAQDEVFLEDDFDCRDCAEGKRLPARSRLMLSNIGRQRLSLHAVPTDRGWACAYLFDHEGWELEGGPCEPGLLDGIAFDLFGYGTDYRLIGFVADGVEDVTVVASQERHTAHVGNNGFLFDASTTTLCPFDIDWLILRWADGRASRVSFPSRAPAILGVDRRHFGCR